MIGGSIDGVVQQGSFRVSRSSGDGHVLGGKGTVLTGKDVAFSFCFVKSYHGGSTYLDLMTRGFSLHCNRSFF